MSTVQQLLSYTDPTRWDYDESLRVLVRSVCETLLWERQLVRDLERAFDFFLNQTADRERKGVRGPVCDPEPVWGALHRLSNAVEIEETGDWNPDVHAQLQEARERCWELEAWQRGCHERLGHALDHLEAGCVEAAQAILETEHKDLESTI